MSTVRSISYDGAVAAAKNDSINDPNGPFAGFFTGAGGDIKVTTVMGDNVTFPATPAGVVVTCQILRVWATGTTPSVVLGMKTSGGL